MKHELSVIACAGAVAVMVVGLSGTAAAAPQLVSQGDIDSIVLSQGTVSGIVGAALTGEKTFSLPSAPLEVPEQPACSAVWGLDSKSVGDDYEAFKGAIRKDGDENGEDHLVIQDAAVYPDTDTPPKLFHDAFSVLRSCDVVHVPSNPANVNWQTKVGGLTDDSAQWIQSVVVDGRPNGWRCAHDVRVQSNVMFDALLCQFGNPSRTVSLLADRMADAASP